MKKNPVSIPPQHDKTHPIQPQYLSTCSTRRFSAACARVATTRVISVWTRSVSPNLCRICSFESSNNDRSGPPGTSLPASCCTCWSIRILFELNLQGRRKVSVLLPNSRGCVPRPASAPAMGRVNRSSPSAVFSSTSDDDEPSSASPPPSSGSESEICFCFFAALFTCLNKGLGWRRLWTRDHCTGIVFRAFTTSSKGRSSEDS